MISSAKQKPRSFVWVCNDDNALVFSMGSFADRFIWFLLVLPPRVTESLDGVILKWMSGVGGSISILRVRVVVTILSFDCERFYQSTNHLLIFVFYCQFYMQKNEIGWIHKCTLILYTHTHTRTHEFTSLEYIYWFAAVYAARSTRCICLISFFLFIILNLCWFFRVPNTINVIRLRFWWH